MLRKLSPQMFVQLLVASHCVVTSDEHTNSKRNYFGLFTPTTSTIRTLTTVSIVFDYSFEKTWRIAHMFDVNKSDVL